MICTILKKMLEALHALQPTTEPVFVSESGVTDTEDIAYLKNLGIRALLIGRAFMESKNPQALAQEWKAV